MQIKRITEKRAEALTKAINLIEPWALIGSRLLDDAFLQIHTTQYDIKRIADDLGANYPYLVQPSDVKNAWDWFRIYGDDWGAEALARKHGFSKPDHLLNSNWQYARAQTKEVLAIIYEYLPFWPSEPLPDLVLDVFKTLHTIQPAWLLFVNRIPPAAESISNIKH